MKRPNELCSSETRLEKPLKQMRSAEDSVSLLAVAIGKAAVHWLVNTMALVPFQFVIRFVEQPLNDAVVL